MLSNCVGTTELNFSNACSIGGYFNSMSFAYVSTELDEIRYVTLSAIAVATNNMILVMRVATDKAAHATPTEFCVLFQE